VRNYTRQVICNVVQTSIYAVTGVLTLGYTLVTILSTGYTHALVYVQVFLIPTCVGRRKLEAVDF